MAKFMGFNSTEIGLMMSTSGTAVIIFCASNGVIVDKFSHRKMVTSAVIITGLLGLIVVTYSSLWTMLCIQITFAITMTLMLWSMSIKAASLLGDHSEQGKVMGWMEGLCGVDIASLAVFAMWVFSRLTPDDNVSLKTVIITYSVVYILLDILCWFFVSDNNNLCSTNNEEKQSFQLSNILTALRISTTWYCSTVIFSVFTIYAILSYSANYLIEMYDMSLVAVSYMGTATNKIFRVLCGPFGGIVTTYSKVKSLTRVVQILSVIGLLALTALLVMNSNPQSVAMGVGLILLLGFTCHASRGLYWVCPGEARTLSYIMGIAVGVCLVIGSLPDISIYPIIDYWQDTLLAVEAYRNIRLTGMTMLGMVIIFTFSLF